MAIPAVARPVAESIRAAALAWLVVSTGKRDSLTGLGLERVGYECAVATSGLQTRLWRTEHGFAHHLIDPARGTPAWTGVVQATALAPTGLEAETLAKTALLLGPHAGRELLGRHGGALVLDDGSLVLAGGLAATSTRAAA